MNEEEKQALEECKILMICLYDYMSIEKSRFYCNQYKIILELIEKQQKEIEDLKFKYQARKDRTKVIIKKQQKEIEKLKSKKYILNAETNEIKEIPISENYISKDKIKEKMKKCNSLLYSFEEGDKLGDRADIGSVNCLLAQIAILNSLLGE